MERLIELCGGPRDGDVVKVLSTCTRYREAVPFGIVADQSVPWPRGFAVYVPEPFDRGHVWRYLGEIPSWPGCIVEPQADT